MTAPARETLHPGVEAALDNWILQQHDFDIPCEINTRNGAKGPSCDQAATHALRCVHCGDSTLLCRPHVARTVAFCKKHLANVGAWLECESCNSHCHSFEQGWALIPLKDLP